MNKGTQPLLISLASTIISIVVGTVAYGALQSEESAQHLVLGSLPDRKVTYTIKNREKNLGCAGSFDISLDATNNQATVTVKGWTLVSLFGRTEQITFDASLVFNALGQLSASVFRTESQHESIRFGTMGVNPITVQLYKSAKDTSPTIEQSLPGPIELKPRKGRYELIAPLYPNVGAPLQHASLPVTFEVDTNGSCERSSARPLDLTPLLQTAAAISDKVRSILPAL